MSWHYPPECSAPVYQYPTAMLKRVVLVIQGVGTSAMQAVLMKTVARAVRSACSGGFVVKSNQVVMQDRYRYYRLSTIRRSCLTLQDLINGSYISQVQLCSTRMMSPVPDKCKCDLLSGGVIHEGHALLQIPVS